MTAATSTLADVLADLSVEGVELDALVSADGVDLAAPTPAVGWTIAHQIAHLRWTDELAIMCCREPARFATVRSSMSTDAGLSAAIGAGAAAGVAMAAPDLLAAWRASRVGVLAALIDVPSGTRLEWLGPPMGAGTMASARIMETWAHGQDIADAIGIARTPTDRLRHVADLGVRTRDHAFRVHGMSPPTVPFRVELTAPSGTVWVWGPDDAAESISGPALDFALLVTQRLHPDDADLRAEGSGARQWLTIAQAFAGAPGTGRPALRG